ncbi:MAG: hypothetical protein WD847_06885 [Pirellulales bacterium]
MPTPKKKKRDYDADVRAWLAKLGLPERKYRDEATAPEVDEHVLGRLARQELTKEEAHEVLGLIHSFRSWTRAFAEALAAEFRRREEQGL